MTTSKNPSKLSAIIAGRRQKGLKATDEWLTELPKLLILDYDGRDRKNLADFKEEFERRLRKSTALVSKKLDAP